MRKLLLVIAVAALFAPAPGAAATDVAAVAQGNGTMKYGGATCVAPLAVSINVRSNTAVVTENWGPGGPGVEACALTTLFNQYAVDTTPMPPVQQCIQGAGISTGPSFTLSQSGQTYTIQGGYRTCNGKTITDKIVVTVQATRLIYGHTYSENGVAVITVNASLPRVA